MRLYHGSNIVIDSINLAMCRPYKDFGQGFYLTDLEEQAEKMATRVSKIYGGFPVVNIYEIDDDFRELIYFIYTKYEFSYKEEMLYCLILANKWKVRNGFIFMGIKLEQLLENENASFYTKQMLYDILADFMIRGCGLGFPECNDILHELKKKGADFYKNCVADSLSEHVSY